MKLILRSKLHLYRPSFSEEPRSADLVSTDARVYIHAGSFPLDSPRLDSSASSGGLVNRFGSNLVDDPDFSTHRNGTHTVRTKYK